jgi:ATP-dependent DNA helicase RecG
MTSQQVQEMLSLGERQRVEFKASTRSVDALGGVVCGFLNTSGGYLICGVQESGEVVGVDASERAITKLEKQFHEGISPKSLISVQVQELEGRPVIVVEVPAGKDVP